MAAPSDPEAMPIAKKRALAEMAGKEKNRISSARTLCMELEHLYSGLDSSFMWNTTQIWELVRPTLNCEPNSGHFYEYVGRASAKKVYESMLAMEAGHEMQVLGALGSGKSTVVSTVSGYLIGCRKKQVVYLCAEQFIQDPESCLLDALLVACGRDDDDIAAMLVSRLPTLKGLFGYCLRVPAGSLLFVVDEWDQFETERELQKMLLQACSQHMLVKISSVNSRERHIWEASDKADDHIKTEHVDGPYNSEELQTWLGQSGLTKDELEDLDHLTGGMPQLLRFYEETKGNKHAFLRKIEKPYTSKLVQRFIGKLESRGELRQALQFVVSGECSPILEGKVDFTCFYMDKGGLFRPLCPYFRSMAESCIMDQHEILRCSLSYNDIMTWAAAVKMECKVDGTTNSTNSARIGWNVESLVISVMRYKKRAFGFEFRCYKRYEHGGEDAALEQLTAHELEGGVLMGPCDFGKKAVDVVYLKLETTQLQIKVLQIAVAQWKELHKIWEEVLQKWKAGKTWEVKVEYYYIMPKTVSLTGIDSGSASLKRLGNVDASLLRLDDMLSLSKLEMPVSKAVMPGKECATKNVRG